jgi:thiol-disulfide isomerase/thioredoxin
MKELDDFTETLLNYKSSSVVKKVEILGGQANSCEHCKSLKGKIISISKALKEKPLSREKCTNPKGCRCCYVPVIDID